MNSKSLPLGGEGAEQSEADEVETSNYIPPPFYSSSLNLIRPAGHLPLPGEGLGFSLSGYTFNFHFGLNQKQFLKLPDYCRLSTLDLHLQ